MERWSGPAKIAWCSEHGLHGARSECFECGKPVEQIPMITIAEVRQDNAGRYLHPSPDGKRIFRLYGCARRGCDRINPDYESYGAYGKSWCLDHVPLRIRLRRWLEDDI